MQKIYYNGATNNKGNADTGSTIRKGLITVYIPNANTISIGKIIDKIYVNKSPGYNGLRMKDL